MDSDKLQPIDELIDSALRAEPLRDVPAGFAGRVMERIALDAADTARAKSSHRLVRPMIAVAAMAAAIIVIPIAAELLQWDRRALPGGMGLLDYAFAWFDLSRMASVADFTIAAAAGLLGLSALLAVGWLVARRPSVHQRAER